MNIEIFQIANNEILILIISFCLFITCFTNLNPFLENNMLVPINLQTRLYWYKTICNIIRILRGELDFTVVFKIVQNNIDKHNKTAVPGSYFVKYP